MAVAGDIISQGVAQIFGTAVQMRRFVIAKALFQANIGIVADGPFAGMKLLPEAAWGDGDLSSKLLGCYEAELHPALAKATSRNPKAVINIGCAEGYYAVGMARLMPHARIHAFDINPKAQDICKRAAVANQVGDRLLVGGKCDVELLRPIIAGPQRSLLFVDCEGAELELLDPVRLREISNCDMLIECHDFVNARITQTLKQRFSKSHDIEDVVEGARDPNQFAALRSWCSIDRWLAIDEARPVTMNWLICWAH